MAQVFITNSSARLNLRAADPDSYPLKHPHRLPRSPAGLILVGQISPFLRGLRRLRKGSGWLSSSASYYRSRAECVHSGCVNGQKCDTETWRAGLVKRNSSPENDTRPELSVSLRVRLVLCYLAEVGNLDILRVIDKLHMWVFPFRIT